MPVNSLAELIAYVKANPGKAAFGSQGNGATPHLTGMMFQGMTGTSMVHIPYRGETLVLNDMIGGHVDVFFGNVSAAQALYRDGRVKIVAVCDTRRAPALPEVPTTAEAGLPQYRHDGGWFAMFAPANTPMDIVEKLYREVRTAMQNPGVREKLASLGVEPVADTPAEFKKFVSAELRAYAEQVRLAGVTAE
jgi:tripartite-type tricarboxylate transporter receptor subunit TctC